MSFNNNLKRFMPEEFSDHLFTRNKSTQMGLAATAEHVAYVLYPELKREFKL